MQQLELHKTSIDLPGDVRIEMIELLNQQLADSFDLYSQAKQAHWNVKGMQFIALHELFDSLAEQLEAFIDKVAERAVALGGTAQGTARQSAAASRLSEFPEGITSGPDHVAALVDRYAALSASTRAAIDTSETKGDMGTADLFTEMVRGLDKSLWFLEAHIQD